MSKNTLSIKDQCRLLVENILDENILDSNETLHKLLNKIQESREESIIKALIAEQDEDEDSDADADEESDGDEPSSNDSELEDNANNDESGENLDGAEDDAQVGNGKLNEMSIEMANLNHSLNKAKIKKLYNKVSTLKSQLNSLNLDTDEMQYVELDTKLSFYAEVLEDLQQQSMPGVDGDEQSEITEKINIVFKALKTLESEINANNGEDENVETSDADNTDVDNDSESDDEGDEDEKSDDESEEGEEEEGDESEDSDDESKEGSDEESDDEGDDEE